MLEILFEDQDLIVVFKLVGMESQSSRGFGADMVSEIKKHIHRLSQTKGEPYVGVIHRLDKPVSGIMVYAKNKTTAAALSKQVSDGSMRKKYQAVVCGKVDKTVDNYVDYILKDEKKNESRIVDKGISEAKIAKLQSRVLSQWEDLQYGTLTLLEIELFTGRHHQIRVQCASRNIPIWGDRKYNTKYSEYPRGAHIGLSSTELIFMHPKSKKTIKFQHKPQGYIFQMSV